MEPKKINGVFHSLNNKNIEEITKKEIKRELSKLSSSKKEDKIDLSEVARKILDYVEVVKKLPDVREEKVKEVMEKISDGAYESKEVLEETLEKIIEEFF